MRSQAGFHSRRQATGGLFCSASRSQKGRSEIVGALITLNGVVQGVGFRPFVHRLARDCGLAGTVRNFSGGVIIEVEGRAERVEEFYRRVSQDAPAVAHVVDKRIQRRPPKGLSTFSVEASTRVAEEFVLVPPDISVCHRCQRELLDPQDRRYRYPFINCTDCGPRFTIIEDMPYDRPVTTMRAFTMCDRCQREYEDIDHRRYHAQPNACPVCGPHLFLRGGQGDGARGQEALRETIARLKRGQIVAIKGIGGFHLCCDATNEQAVRRLRQRKGRPAKPLAIMSLDPDRVRSYCHLSAAEEQLLASPMRPIVILKRKDGSFISSMVAPGNNTLGVVLPYAPVHVLLLERDLLAMVATSANISDQPLISDNRQAQEDLQGIADAFLVHDREIHTRCDDSIFRLIDGQPMPFRRARGYAPTPVELTFKTPSILACGGELKNTFCLARGENAFLSQHIGDLKNVETYQFYSQTIERLQDLFRVRPGILAHDLHPQYLSTRYALERKAGAGKELKTMAVQHHHAHAAACMADNGVTGSVIGVIFDGLGYGADGHIWGAEFMVADYQGYQRLGQLRYVPLPGGDAANREPWRMALSYLFTLCGPQIDAWERSLFDHLDAGVMEAVVAMMAQGFNAPLASSMGRLFDAVSSLLGLCQNNTFEGQAAVSLQVAAEEVSEPLFGYPWSVSGEKDYLIVDPHPLLTDLLADLRRGVPVAHIAHRFHRSVAELVSRCCRHIRDLSGLNKVALSGGVFQNKLLTEMVVDLLRRDEFTPLVHRQVPPNDGGIALGQAAIAGWQNR
jgi:hydrogenase maturation protein HypF